MKTLTFIPHEQTDKYRVKELGYICSLPKTYKGNLVTINNHSAGIGHSCHPNIHKSGSVAGMVNLGYWSKDDRINHSHGFKYNMSRVVCSDPLDELCHALEENRCTKTTDILTGTITFTFKPL